MSRTYATWNPSDIGSGVVLSNGNLTATVPQLGARSVRANIGVSSGKHYWEFLCTETDGSRWGIATALATLFDPPGSDVNGYGYYYLNSGYYYNNTYFVVADGVAPVDTNILMLALDLDNGKLWWGKNGTWYNSGNPATGVNPQVTGLSGTYFPIFGGGIISSAPVCTANFGGSAFTYTPPDGFLAGLWTGYEEFPVETSHAISVNNSMATDVYGWRFISEDVSVSTSFLDNFGEFAESASISFTLADNFGEFLTGILTDDSFTPNGLFNINNYDEVSVGTRFIGTSYRVEIIEDGFTIVDSASNGLRYPIISSDGFNISETVENARVLGILIEDGFISYDLTLQCWIMTAPDTLNVSETVTKILGIPVTDYLSMADFQVNNWMGQEIVAAEIAIYDTPEGVRFFLKDIDDTFDTVDLSNKILGLVIPDYMDFVSELIANWYGIKSVTSSLTVLDSLDGIKWINRLIEETFDIVDGYQYELAIRLLETLDFAELIVEHPTFNKILIDSVSFTGTASFLSHLYSVIQDGVHLNVSVELEGEVYECWVFNTPKFQPSVYSGYDFNSYCSFGDKAYGANATGIYELTGDTDHGTDINTGVILGSSNLGFPTGKRMRAAQLGYTGGTPVLVLEVEDGTRKAFTITPRRTFDGDRNVKGREWILSVADFENLEFIHLIPIVLTR